MDKRNRIKTYTTRLLQDIRYRLYSLARQLGYIPGQAVSARLNKLIFLQGSLRNFATQRLQKVSYTLDRIEQALRLLDPVNVLRRGYSITRHDGKILKDASLVGKGAAIDTTLYKGKIVSTIGIQRRTRNHEQERAACLLPGFDGAGADNQ